VWILVPLVALLPLSAAGTASAGGGRSGTFSVMYNLHNKLLLKNDCNSLHTHRARSPRAPAVSESRRLFWTP
jgi:hypothetical protein